MRRLFLNKGFLTFAIIVGSISLVARGCYVKRYYIFQYDWACPISYTDSVRLGRTMYTKTYYDSGDVTTIQGKHVRVTKPCKLVEQ